MEVSVDSLHAHISKTYPECPTDLSIVLGSGQQLKCHKHVLQSCNSPVLCDLVRRAKKHRQLDLTKDDESAVLGFINQLYSKKFPEEKLDLDVVKAAAGVNENSAGEDDGGGGDLGLRQLATFLKLDERQSVEQVKKLVLLAILHHENSAEQLLQITAEKPNIMHWILQNYCRICHPDDYPVRRSARNGRPRVLVGKSNGFRDPELIVVFPTNGISYNRLHHLCISYQGITILSVEHAKTVILQVTPGGAELLQQAEEGEDGVKTLLSGISGSIQTLWPDMHLVIANPAGMVLDDLSVHNVHRLTLSTAVVDVKDGTLHHIIDNGDIVICGKGLCNLGPGLNHVSIFAKNVVVGSSVGGASRDGDLLLQRLDIETGTNFVKQYIDHDGGWFDWAYHPCKEEEVDEGDDEVTLRIANGCVLSAHQLLVGVTGSATIDGHLLSNSQKLNITKNLHMHQGSSLRAEDMGNVYVGMDLDLQGVITSNNRLNLKVCGKSIAKFGSQIAAPKMEMVTTGEHSIEGNMEGNLALKASAVSLRQTSVMTLEQVNIETKACVCDGLIFLQGNVDDSSSESIIRAEDTFTNNGVVYGEGGGAALKVITANVQNSNLMDMTRLQLEVEGTFINHSSGVVHASTELQLSSQEFENSGRVGTDGKGIVSVAVELRNIETGYIEGRELDVNAKELKNQGKIVGQEKLTLAGNVFTNADTGRVRSWRHTSVDFNTLENEGQITSLGRVDLKLRDQVNNCTAGRIVGNQIQLTSGHANDVIKPSVKNQGCIFAKQNLECQLQSLSNLHGGAIFSGDSLDLTVAEESKNCGSIQATGEACLKFGSTFINENGGHVEGSQLNITAGHMANAGAGSAGSSIHAQQSLNLNVRETLTNGGQVSSHQNAEIHCNSYNNQATGVTCVVKNMKVVAMERVSNDGYLGSDQSMKVETGYCDNNATGALHADTISVVTTANMQNSGRVSTCALLAVRTAGNMVHRRGGVISGSGKVNIVCNENLTSNALIDVPDIQIEAANLCHQSGAQLRAHNGLLQCTTHLVNEGQMDIKSLTTNSATFQNSGLMTGDTVNVKTVGGGTVSINGTMQSTHSTQISAGASVLVGPNGVVSSPDVHLSSEGVGGQIHVANVVHASRGCRLEASTVHMQSDSIIHGGVLELNGAKVVVPAGGVIAALNGIISNVGELRVERNGLFYSGGWWKAFGADGHGRGRVINSSGVIDIAGDAQVKVHIGQENIGFSMDFPVIEDVQINERRHVLPRSYTQYNFRRVVNQSRVLTTTPAKWYVGGVLQFEQGAGVENDKSHIIAGSVTGSVDELRNVDATGERRTTEIGWKRRYWLEMHRGGRKYGFAGPRKKHWVWHRARLPLPPHSYDITISSPMQAFLYKNDSPPPGIGSSQAAQSLLDRGLSRALQLRHENFATELSRPELVINPGRLCHFGSILVQCSTTRPDTGPLVKIDSRLVGVDSHHDSTQAMISSLASPSLVPRYGDTHVEGLLIRNQIVELTGNLLLPQFSNLEEQFGALVNNGSRIAHEFGLTLGEPLSTCQVERLRENIIWMVRQRVELPDGTERECLLPVVYLSPRDFHQHHHQALISARTMYLHGENGIGNQGGLVSTQEDMYLSTGGSLANTASGLLKSDGTMKMEAGQDITNSSADIVAKDGFSAKTGRDFKHVTETASTSIDSTEQATVLGPVSTLFVEDGPIVIQSDRHVLLQAARVGQARGPQTEIRAGQDILMDTVRETHEEVIAWSNGNRTHARTARDVESQVKVDGTLALQGRNFTCKRGVLQSYTGMVTADAENNATFQAGSAEQELHEQFLSHYSSGSVFSAESTVQRQVDLVQKVGLGASIFGAEGVAIHAQNGNLTTIGTQICSGGGGFGVQLGAGKSMHLGGADCFDLKTQSRHEEVDSLFTTLETEEISRQSTRSQEATRIFTKTGDIRTCTLDEYTQEGADLNAADGGVTTQARSIHILPSTITKERFEQVTARESGLTVNASNPLITALQDLENMAQLVGEFDADDDADFLGLAAATTGLTAYNTWLDMRSLGIAGACEGIVSFRVGTTETSQEMHQVTQELVPSTTRATKFVDIVATDGDVYTRGSDLIAPLISMKAVNGNVNILPGFEEKSVKTAEEYSSTGMSLNVGVGPNPKGNVAVTPLNASFQHSESESCIRESIRSVRPTTLTASEIHLKSGVDTRILGSILDCDVLKANVGRNLLMASVQDEEDMVQTGSSTGCGLSVGFGFGPPSVYGHIHHSQERNDAQRRVVRQQARIATASKYEITVAQHTELKGVKISCGDGNEGQSFLNTPTISIEGIQNQESFSRRQFEVRAWAQNNSSTKQSSKLNADGKTGNWSNELPSMRNLGKAESKKLLANLAATQLTKLGKHQLHQAKKTLETAALLEQLAENNADPTLSDSGRHAFSKQSNLLRAEGERAQRIWGPGGIAPQLCTAFQSVTSNDVVAVGLLPSTLSYLVQQKVASEVADLVAEGHMKEVGPLHAGLNAIIASAGSAFRGAPSSEVWGECAAAARSTLLPGVVEKNTGKSERDNEKYAQQIKDTLASLTLGLASCLPPEYEADVREATTVALVNNCLSSKQAVDFCQSLAEAKSIDAKSMVVAKYAKASGLQDVLKLSGLAKGLAEAGLTDFRGLAGFLSQPMKSLHGLRRLVCENETSMVAHSGQQVVDTLKQKLAKIAVAYTESDGEDERLAYALGNDIGKFLRHVCSAVTTGAGLGRSAVKMSQFGFHLGRRNLENNQQLNTGPNARLGFATMLRVEPNFFQMIRLGDRLNGMSTQERWYFAETLGREFLVSQVKSALLDHKLVGKVQEIGKMLQFGQQGIGGLYKVTVDEVVGYMVAEFNSGLQSRLNWTKDGLQMSDQWCLAWIGRAGLMGKDAAAVRELLRAGKVLKLMVNFKNANIALKVLGKDGRTLRDQSKWLLESILIKPK